MAWVKSDNGNTTDITIAGEGRAMKLWLKNGNLPYFSVTTTGNPIRNVASSALPYDEWHHLTGSYSATTGLLALYIDGKLRSTYDFGVTGLMMDATSSFDGTFDIGDIQEMLLIVSISKEILMRYGYLIPNYHKILSSKIIYQEIEEIL